jgi:NAD(P)-dependent dehydrogenase (short-subunit alcohol dehydrogenase family)
MTNSFQSLRIFVGAVAIITGGASGIGAALARELARRGGEVVLADLQRELAEEVVVEIRKTGGKASAIQLNVADFPAVKNLAQETVQRTGRLDYLFNNAGIGIGGPVHLHRIEDWNRIIDVNLRGVIHGVQAAYPIMLDQGFGHIVNTASMAGLQPAPGVVSYGTTKHAVVGLSKSLRVEAAMAGIRVSVLCPGVIRTPILEGGKYGKLLVDFSPEEQREMWEKLKPMPPEIFASRALDAIAKNKAIIIIPSWWKLFWWINRLSPSLGISLAQRQYRNMPAALKGWRNNSQSGENVRAEHD